MDRQCLTELLRSCDAANSLMEVSSKSARKFSKAKEDRIRAAMPDPMKQLLVVDYLTFGNGDMRPIHDKNGRVVSDPAATKLNSDA